MKNKQILKRKKRIQKIEFSQYLLITIMISIFNINDKYFSIYFKNVIEKNKVAELNEKQIQNEILILNDLLKIKFLDIKNVLKEKFQAFSSLFEKMPEFISSDIEIKLNDVIKQNENNIKQELKDRTFIFDKELILKPIENNEKISFRDLKGYKKQQEILFKNTKALLDNQKVNNILLYGDAGCGKSSSVRALLNEFSELKIVQIFKNNLINLDKLYSILKDLPYKFIIFADDITFNEDDETFSTMKAILEGSLIQCPKNAVIYATSNRRHLIKESFSARKGDEIHLNDTINELNSLSERFGINLFFQKPNNEEFNNIVLELAQDNNINIEKNVLLEKAQRLALIKGSRSPRVARQLIDNLIANIDI